MIIITLKNYINRNYIISEHLHPMDMLGYMDSVIDDINEDLQATFPTFSDWQQYCTDHPELGLDANNYSAFPDSYLRKVVAPGAALKFYSNDEEGEQVASKFYIDYEKARANMVRDYLHQVPDHFQDKQGGYVGFINDIESRGMELFNGDSSL